MSLSAPKCRTCGKVEWNHTCSGVSGNAQRTGLTRKPTATSKATPISPAPEKSSGRRIALPASLIKWREAHHLSQEDVANRLDVSARTVMNWEKTEKAGKPLDRLIYLAIAGLDATA